MSNRRLDVVFVNPDSSAKAYQGLADIYSAKEPPTWALLLAQACRSNGFGVAIIDCDAERLNLQQAVQRIKDLNPRLVCFAVYGQNPNSGTTSMIGATELASALKETFPQYLTCFVGSHTSALPKDVLAIDPVDFVLLNEGVYAIQNLLRTDLIEDLDKVAGIGYKKGDSGSGRQLILNRPEKVVLLAKSSRCAVAGCLGSGSNAQRIRLYRGFTRYKYSRQNSMIISNYSAQF